MLVLLEVVMIKLGFYLVQGARISLLELCSCSGYKFLGANLALASKHVVCPEAGWAAIAMSSASIGTLIHPNPNPNPASSPNPASNPDPASNPNPKPSPNPKRSPNPQASPSPYPSPRPNPTRHLHGQDVTPVARRRQRRLHARLHDRGHGLARPEGAEEEAELLAVRRRPRAAPLPLVAVSRLTQV